MLPNLARLSDPFLLIDQPSVAKTTESDFTRCKIVRSPLIRLEGGDGDCVINDRTVEILLRPSILWDRMCEGIDPESPGKSGEMVRINEP